MPSPSPVTSSEFLDFIQKDSSFLNQVDGIVDKIDNIEIDNEINSLNIAISLRDIGKLDLSLRLLERIIGKFPKGHIGYYESALCASRLMEYSNASKFISQALALNTDSAAYRSFAVRLHAAFGQPSVSEHILRTSAIASGLDADQLAELAQFTDYCRHWPVAQSRDAVANLKQRGAYAEASGVAAAILSAIREDRPFSFLRLGDGEGAWISIDGYDQGKFSKLYDSNRRSFLVDWFGSDALIADPAFTKFSAQLQARYHIHDIIGIPPLERINQELGYLSTRGIPSSINVLRYFGLLNEQCSRVYCSNSVNLSLSSETRFYQDLLSMNKKLRVITSHSGLSDLLTSRGGIVDLMHLVPGDSRNFHYGDLNVPMCQFPDFLHKTDQSLRTEDLSGVVYLVAAGFVGKQYIATIRERGGTALDVGSLADHWAKHGV